MKRNPMPLFLLTVALVLAFGLLFTGCGLNQADTRSVVEMPETGTDNADLDNSELESEAERQAQLQAELEAEREAELAAQRQDLARREAEIAARETQIAAEQAQARADAEAAALQPILLNVPSFTQLEIDLDSDLSSETSLAGDTVNAILAQDVIVDGLVAIAAGSELQGVIVNAVPTRSFGGQAQLQLSFDRLIAGGESLPIAAVLDLSGQRQKKKDAATIGGSAAGGAVLGRILNDRDRDEGTAVGAVVGAAIGAIVAANNKVDPIELPAGSPLVLTLGAPLTIEIDPNG